MQIHATNSKFEMLIEFHSVSICVFTFNYLELIHDITPSFPKTKDCILRSLESLSFKISQDVPVIRAQSGNTARS